MDELHFEWDKQKDKANIKNMAFLSMMLVWFSMMKKLFNFLILTIPTMKTVLFYLE